MSPTSIHSTAYPSSPMPTLLASVGSYTPKPAVSNVQLKLGPAYDSLMQQARQHSRKGQYDEAEEAKSRLEMLKTDYDQLICKVYKSSQKAYLKAVSEAHGREREAFAETWRDRMDQHALASDELRRALNEKLRHEHKDFMAQAHETVEPKPRWSRDYLEKRQIQAALVSSKRYTEASAAKLGADKLQALEEKAWEQRRDTKIAGMEKHFLEKQEKERQVLEKRIATAVEELEKTKESETEVLLARFSNIKSEVQLQQRIAAKTVAHNPGLRSPFMVSAEQIPPAILDSQVCGG